MNLYLHELTHLTLSLFVGLIIWKISGSVYVISAALMGGFFIDLDHLLDYFLAFGTKFNLTYFLKGYSFLKTDKIYVIFHSWELIIFLFFTILFFINFITLRALLFSFSLSLFLHLSVDVFTNNMKAQSYFLLYRLFNKFELKTLVTTDHYQKHIERKKFNK
ncbi:MAG: hypothetical protein UR15_C0007G0002 [Parcubacteria group bacterium GW2011_GWA2_31_28]|nr:MAG: hypothetical protein UR15_C0007G0002 [Parcubacteria group bacterium GW2011_GWA2_31_28]